MVTYRDLQIALNDLMNAVAFDKLTNSELSETALVKKLISALKTLHESTTEEENDRQKQTH
jgi:hypothetical protein